MRRVLAPTLALVALALAGVGCDGADDEAKRHRPGERSGDAAPGARDEPGERTGPTSPSDPDDGGDDDTPAPPPGDDDADSDSDDPRRPRRRPGEAPPPREPPPTLDDDGAVGSMGPALLSSVVPRAVIEEDHGEGVGLVDQSREALADHLRDDGGKSEVTFGGAGTVPSQDVYTDDELRALAAGHRDTASSSARVSLYVLTLPGRYQDDGVVGVAFSATAVAVFPEQLRGGLLGLNYGNYEEAVAVHELGHLFGLVNLTGHGAFHEDPEHPGHSANAGSVMHWAVERTLVGDVFEGGPPRDFDAADEQEMAAIRAG